MRMILLVLLSLMLVLGCATRGFVEDRIQLQQKEMYGYLNTKADSLDAATNQKLESIEVLVGDMQISVTQTQNDMNMLRNSEIESLKVKTDDLSQQTDDLYYQLSRIPDNSIRRLHNVLTLYLEEKDQSNPEKEADQETP